MRKANQSSWPAKVLSMHTESLSTQTVRMILFLRRGSYYIFFIFQLCKIVWGNYVPQFSIWAPSWEKPRGHLKLHVPTIKVPINRAVWSSLLLFATWKVWLFRLLYATTHGFWDWAGQFLSIWSIGTPEDRFSSDEAQVVKHVVSMSIFYFCSKP